MLAAAKINRVHSETIDVTIGCSPAEGSEPLMVFTETSCSNSMSAGLNSFLRPLRFRVLSVLYGSMCSLPSCWSAARSTRRYQPLTLVLSIMSSKACRPSITRRTPNTLRSARLG